MDRTIGYLREILSNYTDQYPVAQDVYEKIKQHNFSSEEELVRHLTGAETQLLNKILPEEIEHAKDSQDEERFTQLSEVYELLIV